VNDAARHIVGPERRVRVSHHQNCGEGGLNSRRRVNFYEAGFSQEEIWDDWFTLLFEVIQLDSQAIVNVVASLNWCDEAHSQATRFVLKLTPELFVISIDLRTCSLTTKVHLND